MRRSFPNIKHVLVVGIAGGIPCYGPNLQEQIVLGDVVVSCPQGSEGGVAHYEFGAWEDEYTLNPSGHTLHPSSALLAAVNSLRSNHMRRPGTKIPQLLLELRESLTEDELPEFEDPGDEHDYLFPDNYPHSDGEKLCQGHCDLTQSKRRSDRGRKATRKNDTPRIHYGIIGSANTLVISSAKRNELYGKHRIICFEMEAAGVISEYQALVIRGICDYADSHKNKKWQKYAAATAATYAKEVLLLVPPAKLDDRNCLKSLAFPQMESRSHDIAHAVTGTCEWLLRHHTYKRWAACNQGLLWIKGKPGSGKSTLLKYALNHLKPKPDDLVLSFFFHSRGDQLQKTPLGFFRSLLHQILRRAPDALRDLVEIFHKRRKEIGEPGEKWQWHQQELRRFFESSLPKVLEARSVWLFVDALDESGKENAVDLFQWLQSLLRMLPPTGSQCRICLTCRHYPILSSGCEFEICPEHENGQDISTYVRVQLSDFHDLTASPIPALITNGASGVFMWARLVINQVLDLEREGAELKEIQAAVHSTPPDLDELYRGLIQQMGSSSRRLVEWICFATRPLTLDELRMKRKVQALSCGLAEVTPSPNRQVVQFIHQSVKDFFVEKGLGITLAHVMSRYEILGPLAAILGKGDQVIEGADARDGSGRTPLSWAAWKGHETVVKLLLDTGKVDVDSKDNEYGQTPLSWAARNGHEAVVKLLLDTGKVDVDSKDNYGQTPLSWAAENGHEAVVKLLLDTGKVDVDSKDNEYGQTPLSCAAENGHEAVVKLLESAK
ncbi:hypothetical protein DL764_006550 [Monosporascus ibericus]|uniref:NACHT domain-containing protein n=1 Tax=Monosporascus ibericus TaxID=155417 RepID=A0A4Q4T4H2_9PEZI|nr:hypothetical protein DL764_006550 [Monosporascus ibericus]